MISSATETRSVHARGLETGWLQSVDPGPGTPILFLLHGFPDSPATWAEQFDVFARGHWVIAPFLRGVGPSAASDDLSRYGATGVLLDHLAILRQINPTGDRKVVVVGHDIGTLHAWELARALGPRLSHLVVLNGASLEQMVRRVTNLKQLRRSWYVGVFAIPFLGELLLRRMEPRFKRRTQRKHSTALSESIGLLPHYRAAIQKAPRAAKRKIPRVSAPVLALWSALDPFLVPPNQTELDRLAERATIRRLPGGHWVHSDMPSHFNQALKNFLEVR